MEEMMIKDAAKRLGIEAHVLRYWEDELGLEIKRNKMGHRYYDEKDLRLFSEIMKLKDEGLSLKDIRMGIDKARKEYNAGNENDGNTDKELKFNIELEDIKKREPSCEIGDLDSYEACSSEELKVVDFKTAQLQMLMNKVVANALRENKGIITNSIRTEITENVIKQMDIVLKEKEEREEERFRRFDDCLRQIQRANEEAAVTKNRKWFGRKKY